MGDGLEKRIYPPNLAGGIPQGHPPHTKRSLLSDKPCRAEKTQVLNSWLAAEAWGRSVAQPYRPSLEQYAPAPSHGFCMTRRSCSY